MSGGHGPKSGIRFALKKYILGFDPLDLHDFVEEWLGEFGISRALSLSVIFVGILTVINMEIPNFWLFALGWLLGTAPMWLPAVLWISAWRAWINYARSHFLSTRHPILLEVKIPREILKSPRAMEFVFANLRADSGETGFVARVLGSVFPWFSFEIASFGGETHFYVWCWKAYKRLVEASIYAQYPEVEIVEVEDYTLKLQFDPERHTAFCGDFIYYGRGWPGDEYPLKSYVDFELDEDPDIEVKTDPLAETFEVLSSLKSNEIVWMHMYFRVMARLEPGVLIRYPNDWKERVIREVEKLRVESATLDDETFEGLTENQKRNVRPRATWRQGEMMKIMERHLGKNVYEIGMRHIYIADGEYSGPTASAIRWIYKPFNSPQYFNFIRSRRGHNPFDYPWQDFRDWRWNKITRNYIDMMRRRSFFYTPWTTPPQVMSTEMMATLYHYPSSEVKSPGLQRISAKKSEPPINLPR